MSTKPVIGCKINKITMHFLEYSFKRFLNNASETLCLKSMFNIFTESVFLYSKKDKIGLEKLLHCWISILKGKSPTCGDKAWHKYLSFEAKGNNQNWKYFGENFRYIAVLEIIHKVKHFFYLLDYWSADPLFFPISLFLPFYFSRPANFSFTKKTGKISAFLKKKVKGQIFLNFIFIFISAPPTEFSAKRSAIQ